MTGAGEGRAPSQPPGLHRIGLPGNREVVVRPVEAGDAQAIKALFSSLCEEELYRRFFSYRPPPDSFLEKMTRMDDLGGYGVVAVLDAPERPARIVAEASYHRLPDGDAELGITVEGQMRGWLGPYLVDVLVERARSQGIPNLQAEVLITNRQMLAVMEARGSAVIGHYDNPAIVRVCIGTAGRFPRWADDPGRPRVLVELPGARWRAADAAREAGFQVLACQRWRRGLARCPALDGAPCPLASAADVIVDAVAGEAGRILLDAHVRLHPAVPVCVDFPAEVDGDGVVQLGRELSPDQVVGVVERLARCSTARGVMERM